MQPFDQALMTGSAARIAKRLIGYWDELPGITAGMQGEAEDPIRAGVADLAVGGNGGDGRMIGPARPDDELADAARRIQSPAGSLRGKTLINMGMTVQDHIHIGVIKELPEWLDLCTGEPTGAEEGDMPVSQGASGRIGGKVILEPGVFR